MKPRILMTVPLTRLLLPLLVAFQCLLTPTLAQSDEITLNLKDADIVALITTVAEVTGKNFVIDPRVKGKVTVVSSKPMDADNLYQVFLSILRVHGFAAVPSGSVIKIVPDANAKSDNVGMATGFAPGIGDEFITRVVEIKNVPAAQLVPILRPLVPQQGHLAAYQPSNVLIISDRAANVDRLVRIIRRIDLASTAEIDVMPLQHASATEVVRIMAQLEPTVKKPDAGGGTKLVADERTNSVLISGDKSGRLRMRAIITHLDTPLETGGNTHVVYLRNASAKDLVEVLQGVSSDIVAASGAGQPAVGKGIKARVRRGRTQIATASIRADENMNALVITAPPGIYRALLSVIRQLDIRRAQVMVEAIIAEIKSDKLAEFGVQWRSTNSLEGASTGFGGTSFSTGSPPIAAVAGNPLSGVGDGLTLGFIDGTASVLGTEFLNIGALLRIISSDVHTNILSTPTLVTLDNQEAEIIVGQNVPFVTGSFTSAGASDSAINPFQTIERQDVGITLRIKPQINEGNAVKLDIYQEVSSVAPSTLGASDLVTNKRSITTSVIVEDGQMLVLGGLMDDGLDESVQKVPFLGDLPLIGNLFKSRKTTHVKTNLMVFLRTTILRDSATQSVLSNGKYLQFRALQMTKQKAGVSLMPGDTQPLLPELYPQLPPDAEAPEPAAAPEQEQPETASES